MAEHLTVIFNDVNGDVGRTSFWCNDALTAVGAIQALANLSNAQVVRATFSKEIALGPLNLKNAAVAANVETVGTKAKLHLSGPDAGSVAKPRDDVTISIPAPIGTLINGANQAPPSTLTPIVALIQSDADVAMDRVERLYYSKSR